MIAISIYYKSLMGQIKIGQYYLKEWNVLLAHHVAWLSEGHIKRMMVLLEE